MTSNAIDTTNLVPVESFFVGPAESVFRSFFYRRVVPEFYSEIDLRSYTTVKHIDYRNSDTPEKVTYEIRATRIKDKAPVVAFVVVRACAHTPYEQWKVPEYANKFKTYSEQDIRPRESLLHLFLEEDIERECACCHCT